MKNLMERELSFPVIVISNNDYRIFVYFSEKNLKATSKELLRKLDYTNLEIIDSLGNKFKIKRAFKVKYLGLWGYNPFLKGRQILIDFQYMPDAPIISLEDLKIDLIRRVEANRTLWQTGWDIKELVAAIYRCETFDSVAKLLK